MAISDIRTLKPEFAADDLTKCCNFIKIIYEDEEIQKIADEMDTKFPADKQGKLPRIAIRTNALILKLFSSAIWLAQQKEKVTELYVWNNVRFVRVFLDDLSAVVFNIFMINNWYDLGSSHKKHIFETVRQMALRQSNYTGICPNDKCDDYIPFWNGYIDIVGNKFINCIPEAHITHCIPQILDVNKLQDPDSIKCPGFKSFICRILPDKVKRQKVLAYMAYCFTSTVRKHYAQIWTGGGRNGKSTLIEIFCGLIGRKNYSLVNMSAIKKLDRFVLSQMEGKILNNGSEMSSEDLTSSTVTKIKALIANSHLSDQKKGVDGYTFKNVTKQLFDVNDLCLIKAVMDYAFFERLEIIEFDQWVGHESELLEGLSETLLKHEGNDILTYILTFLPAIDVVLKTSAQETMLAWRNNVLTPFLFASKFMKPINRINKEVLLTTLYGDYSKWCIFHGKKPHLIEQFEFIINKTCGFDLNVRRNDIKVVCAYYDFTEKLELSPITIRKISRSKTTLKRIFNEYKIVEMNEKEKRLHGSGGINLFDGL
jgi:hypothetical protein